MNANDDDDGQTNPALASLLTYIAQKSTPNTALTALLQNPDMHVGLVLSERFRNMPVETIPPLYRLLLDEIDGKPAYAVRPLFFPLLKSNDDADDDDWW